MSRKSDLADAIVTALNAADLSQEFTAERVPVVDEELTATADLQVLVCPAKRVRDLETRGDDLFVHQVDVVVLQQLSMLTNAVVDPLDLLQEEIEDELMRAEITTADDLQWTCDGMETLEGAEAGPAWQMLKNPRVYMGFSRFRFVRTA